MAVNLSDDMKSAINNAMADSAPMVLSSVDPTGQPNLSFRGSTHVYSEHELAIWVRNQDGGLLRSLEANPKVAFMYRNPATRTAFMIHGEARRVDDQAVRDAVYNGAPEVEQKADAEKKGTAVIVDIVRVVQRGQVVAARDASEVTVPAST